jgi:hypothetical protein
MQNASESDCRSASQETIRVFTEMIVHYHIHKSPSSSPVALQSL